MPRSDDAVRGRPFVNLYRHGVVGQQRLSHQSSRLTASWVRVVCECNCVRMRGHWPVDLWGLKGRNIVMTFGLCETLLMALLIAPAALLVVTLEETCRNEEVHWKGS